MKIKRLYINNYKSLVNFELIGPNPFSVFVGPNAAGKSNVFEALEFLSVAFESNFIAAKSFDGPDNFIFKPLLLKEIPFYAIDIELIIDDVNIAYPISYVKENGKLRISGEGSSTGGKKGESTTEDYELKKTTEEDFTRNFSRIFLGIRRLIGVQVSGSDKLRIDAANLEPVLHRILQDEAKQEEIIDWLQILIPELDRIEVAKSDLSGDYFLRIFEKHLDDPIGKNLISDGTYNILALLTAVYQSDEPQFLCIEEPENGLNPYVIRTLVGFFRQMCEEKGHYIWLNTHSATLVRELKNEEIILIDKKEGITRAKQIPADFNRYDLEMDEAWLTNALGGGLPW